MAKQKSINFGRKHANPIPNACRIGNIVMSSVIVGTDPETGELPPTLAEQTVNMFAHMRGIAEAAGGSIRDIIKMTVWLKDLNDRKALNEQWLAMYPNPDERPARHALLHVGAPEHLILCDITMVITQEHPST